RAPLARLQRLDQLLAVFLGAVDAAPHTDEIEIDLRVLFDQDGRPGRIELRRIEPLRVDFIGKHDGHAPVDLGRAPRARTRENGAGQRRIGIPRGFSSLRPYGTNPQRACASSISVEAASRLSMMTRIVGAML